MSTAGWVVVLLGLPALDVVVAMGVRRHEIRTRVKGTGVHAHNEDGELRGAFKVLLVLVGLVALGGATAWLYPKLRPPAPTYHDPGIAVLIIENPMVLGLARCALVIVGTLVAVYLLFSVIVHIWQGRWVVAWGSAKTAREVNKVKQNRRELRTQLGTADTTIKDLTEKLEAAEGALAQLVSGGTLSAGGSDDTGTASGGPGPGQRGNSGGPG
jgi:hypothetical protein